MLPGPRRAAAGGRGQRGRRRAQRRAGRLPAAIGGLGTVWGPVVGAALLVPIEQFAQRELGGTYAGGQLVLYGLLVILVLRFLPEGIVGIVARAYAALLARMPGYRVPER